MFTQHKAEKHPPCGGSEDNFKIGNGNSGGIMRETGLAQQVVFSSVPHHAYRSKAACFMAMLVKPAFKAVVIFQTVSR